MNEHEMHERITSLETRLMHQEASIEELTNTLLAQERLLKLQAETIQRLEDQLQGLAGSHMAAPGDETPPPHY